MTAYDMRIGDGSSDVCPSDLMVEDAAAAKRLFQRFEKVAEGVFLTRDLVSEPANVLFPKSLAAEAKKLDKLGVKVTVLGEKEMKRLGMGALLGVAQGPAQEPPLPVMQWNGAGAKDPGGKGRATRQSGVGGRGGEGRME